MPGPILDLDTVKAKYKGSSEDNFRIEKIFLDSMNATRLPLITAKNSSMDATWKLDKVNRRIAIMAMPDNHTRQSFHEQKHKLMDAEQVICHNLFTEVMGFIDVKWASDIPTADSKKQKQVIYITQNPQKNLANAIH